MAGFCNVRCLGVASQLLLVAFVLPWVCFILRSTALVRHSRRFRLPDTRLVIPGGRGWAIPTQCWAHSVPFTTAHLLRAGGRFAVLDVRLTFTSAFIRVTSHLQRSGVIHTRCRCRSLNPTQARCLLHLAAVAASICSIHSYPYFGDISAQDGVYLSCPFIWASFYWSPKRNWQGCLYRCWSWARYPSPHCGSGSTQTQSAATVGGPRFFTSIPWGIAAVFVPSK